MIARLFAAWPFRRAGGGDLAGPLYRAVVAQARQPAFYRAYGVPDSLDGRFELIALHAFLVLHRLKAAAGDGEAAALGQALVDALVADMDVNLREMGAGDLGVAPRVKRMAQAFYGRVEAYDAGLAAPAPALAAALRRNLYGTAAPSPAQLDAMAAYLRAGVAGLAGSPVGRLRRGEAAFAVPAEAVDGAPASAPGTR